MSKFVPSTWQDFPPVLAARFGLKAGKQRTMSHEGHLVLVLHHPPKASEVERRAAIFWRNPSGTWKAGGEAKGGLGALKALVESFTKEALALETALESATQAADYFRILQEVAPRLRSARGLHRTLQEARELLKSESEIISLRDQAYEAERTFELVQQDASAGLDFTVARRAEEQAALQERIAKSSHRLNLIAALFLPISALGGIFGANLSHGLETAGAPFLFWAFVASALVLGLFVRSTVASVK
jgi:Mg2+ and Co2+ transporter CorA